MATLTELLTYKIPPQNLEAERAVLGAILLENETLPRAIEILTPPDFYKEGHRKIFSTMIALFERNEPVDLLTLSEELRRRGELDEVGGAAALAALVEEAATAAHLLSYAMIVREKALLRELIRSSTEIIGQSYEAQEDVESLLDQAERMIFEVSERRMLNVAIPVRSVLKETFEYIETLYQRKEHVTGLPTGFRRLDQMTSGFQNGEFVIVAGRPSMGKTAFALNVAQHVGCDPYKKRVLIFSLEMSKEQLVQRLLCSEARVDSHRVRTGYLEPKDWPRLTNAAGRLADSNIFIDDTAALSVLEARAKARRMKAEHGLDLVVIDYLQLMRGRGAAENRQQEISEISRSLKALAKELRIPVVALSQLSRAVEARATRDYRPQLSDLRECVTGETLVVLGDGQRVPIRDLVGTAPEVWAMSPEGSLVVAKSEKIWRVGMRPVFAIRLASGRVIRATEQHRLFAARGWSRVSELSVGDRVAIARRLPEPLFPDCWSDLRVALLGHLIGDGSYLANQPLRYTTSSEENSRLVSEAARKEFGCEVKRYKGRGTWHQLLISGNGDRWHPDGVNRWLRGLGVFGQRSHEKQGISQRRMATLRGTAYGGSSHFRFAPSRAILAEYAEILNDEDLCRRASNDLFWDRIIAVEADGEEEVFDLTVPGPASWLADGIVSHNSGALEQDGDLVIFLYRPERYKKEGEVTEEDRNLAEVIIGKQRNGPTGTIRLTFLPEYARFDEREEGRRQPF